MEYITLNNGVKMPQLGLGVMEIENGATGEQVILDALEAGYRMIDTATVYFIGAKPGFDVTETLIYSADGK